MIAAFMGIILVFAAVSGYNYYLSRESLKREIINNFNIQTRVFADELARDIARVKSSLNLSFYDDDISKLTSLSDMLSDYELGLTINRVGRKLRDIGNASPYIGEVTGLFRVPNLSIYSRKPYGEFDQREFDDLYAAYQATSSAVKYWDGHLLLMSDSGMNARPDSIHCLLAAEIAPGELTARAEKLVDYDTSGLLLYSAGRELLTGVGNRIGDSEALIAAAEKSDGAFSYVAGGRKYTAILQGNETFDIRIIKYVADEDIFSSLQSFLYVFILCCVLLAILSLFYLLYINQLINKPLQLLKRCFSEVENRNLSQTIDYTYKDEFNDIYQGYNSMVRQLDYLINQVYEKQLAAQRTELKYLQSQINPHFLYNNFYILHRMIKMQKNDKAEALSAALGQYFQYITRSAKDDVELEREADHAKAYANIQMIRFGDRIRVEFGEIPQEARALPVPRIILQPLLENAFEHGFRDVENDGLLRVSYQPCPDGLRIVVEDNGCFDPEAAERLRTLLTDDDVGVETTALINIHRRLRLRFGEGSGVDIGKSDLGGMMITLTLLYLQEGDAGKGRREEDA